MATIINPQVLLLTDDPTVAERIRAALLPTEGGSFDVEWVRRMSEGLGYLMKNKVTAILAELSLPDSRSIETFERLVSAAPDVPILILGGNREEVLAKEAVAHGAQDYLL